MKNYAGLSEPIKTHKKSAACQSTSYTPFKILLALFKFLKNICSCIILTSILSDIFVLFYML